MSDFFDKVTSGQDIFKKLLSYVPGFSGYIERDNRRTADKLMRDTIAQRFEELYKRLSALQSDLVSNGGIAYMDDMEKSAIKIRTFADKIRNATYGYAGFFDAVKVNEDELAKIYAFDAAFFEIATQLNAAMDTVEGSMADNEALPAAIRNLVTLSRQAVETFDRRTETITGSGQ